jgi:7SK snRNA methylphosphate capping enzyme
MTPESWPRVKVVAADWLLSTDPQILGPYHLILALNVIKWIHLEHLDHGLLTFFRKCQTSLVPGGYLVVQLQTWKSYEKAVRPNAAPHFADNLAKLKYRPETSFAKLLQDEGLNLHATSTLLSRRIDIYRKTSERNSAGS